MSAKTTRADARPLLDLTAADLMKAPVLTIPQDTPLREAARLLARSGISGAPVVDEGGRCVGVLSSSDFVTWAGKGGDQSRGETVHFIAPWGDMIDVDGSADTAVRQYLTPQPVAVAPDTPLGGVAEKMVDAHIHRVLVVREGHQPCGIITSTDVLAAVGRAARQAALKR
jgi:CBS domain-containing protein